MSDDDPSLHPNSLPPARPDVVLIDRRTVYRGFYRVDRYRLQHAHPHGGWTGELEREVFERGHAAALLPYDPWTDEVVLVRQFRPGPYAAGHDPWMIEIPAGVIEGEDSPEAVARRECAEECGLDPDLVLPVTTYLPSPGSISETVHVFCGRVRADAHARTAGLMDEGEFIEPRRMKVADLPAALETGLFNNALTILATQWLLLRHPALRAAWI